MDNKNNHINYSAADIEKYHRGLLSRSEMHAMEKAAMDDPFLADSIEGFAVEGTDISNDLTELREKLAARTGDAKLVPFASSPLSRNFMLVRIAAMLIFIVGAGLLIYQFGFNNKQQKIAQADQKTTTAIPEKVTDSPSTANANQPADIKLTDTGADSSKPAEKAKLPADPVTANTNLPTPDKSIVAENKPAIIQPVVDKPGNIKAEEVVVSPSRTRGFEQDDESIKKSRKTEPKTSPVNDGALAKDQSRKEDKLLKEKDNTRDIATSRQPDNNYQANNYTFRGQVTDNRNRAVPFANVTSLSDNDASTYTDSRGYFNFVHPDSVVQVEIRSVGYENTNAQLRNYLANQRVVMNEDINNSKEIIANRQVGRASKGAELKKLEAGGPVDGWEKYQTYLLNNLKVPDDFTVKPAGAAVELSFEISKSGTPTNVQVIKSLCSSCDQEAIRLLKEGPKWKRKSRKERTTIVIPF